MTGSFAVVIVGGTGQVGSAVVDSLLRLPQCREVVMVTRRPVAESLRVRNVVCDTSAESFAGQVAVVAREALAAGRASAISCVGIGTGSGKLTEEELKRTELGVVGAFARGCRQAVVSQFCLLSAAGSSPRSRIKYARVMGMKEETVRAAGFGRVAIFRPGIIVGNAHTPGWISLLGRLVPGPFGNIQQADIGRAMAAEIALHSGDSGVVIYSNAAMRREAARLNTVV